MKAAGAPPDDLIRKVGAAIAAQRKAAGFTQLRVANEIEVEKETISRIENGVIAPSLHRLGQFAKLFSCPLSALLGDYRGSSGEDAGAIAAQIGDLPRDDRRAILRIVEDIASIARERETLRARLDAAGRRESERAQLEAIASAARERPRSRKKP
ncbi:helix-turn-helix transcriptional regulator [Caballeronia udeis]|uniref:helix-turn-helix transcriptional regulator n=1 Tax=Caballeronia udeis TaxID=1232866 RepID=UPI000781427A|nr:helix-turn-helix transcriptional regulator [Caballeronia udeis]